VNARPQPDSWSAPDDDRLELLAAGGRLNPVVGHLCPYCASARARPRGPCGTCVDLRRRHERALGRLYVISLVSDSDPAYRWVAELKDFAGAEQRAHNARCIAATVSLWWEHHASSVADYLGDDFVSTTLGTTHAVLQTAGDVADRAGWPFPPLVDGIAKAPAINAQRRLRRHARLNKSPVEWEPTAELSDACAVLLVDDIYTTGATMHSAARRLKDEGVLRVAGLAFTRKVAGPTYVWVLNRRRETGSVMWTPESIWASAD